MTDQDPIVGIDLGTTNSIVAFADEKGPRVLAPPDHSPLLPSAVRFDDDGAVLAVGDDARADAIDHPRTTISSVKRLMGRSVQDARDDLPYLAYDVAEGPRDTARVRLPSGNLLAPEEVSAVILRALRDRASASLGTQVNRAVITVPAYFDDAQRQATRAAARLAGLDTARIINEPTAAALAYGIGLANRQPETIAVFDLGGGTFDISILKVIPGAEAGDDVTSDFFQVLATAGDTRLGGDDVDQAIIQLLMTEAHQRFGRELEFTPTTRRALRALAENAKIRLSDHESATLRVELQGADAPYERVLTREELDTLITPWADRALQRCQRALRDAKLKPDDIDKVVMVGGSTRIPLVRRRVAEFFRTDPYTALDPDLVVAMGAAVQGLVLSGSDTGTLLLDVLPLSLGIETMGGAVAKLIIRNSSIPARATEMFSTSVDGQTSIKLHVLQGEREMVEDCRSLGEFHIRGIPPMPAGIPQLEVTFLVDANGVLNVSALEKRSGVRAAMQIVPNHGLTHDEVLRMEAESLQHAREDMTRHRVADLIANASLDLKWITERLDALADEVPDDLRADLLAKADDLRTHLETARSDWTAVDPDQFLAAKNALDNASVRLHELSIARSLRDDD